MAPRWVVERAVPVYPSIEAAYDSDVAVSRHEVNRGFREDDLFDYCIRYGEKLNGDGEIN